jgi:hypothetical protein
MWITEIKPGISSSLKRYNLKRNTDEVSDVSFGAFTAVMFQVEVRSQPRRPRLGILSSVSFHGLMSYISHLSQPVK